MSTDFHEASSVFLYEPDTGVIRNRIDRLRSSAGDVVTRPGKKGYLFVFFSGRSMPAHRMAWLLFHGALPNIQIDHINLDKQDNRISNLRLASNSENAMNRALGSRNTSGCKGVYWKKASKKWIAVVRREGKYLFRKGFDDKLEADQAARDARDRFHGEFARHE